MQTRQQPQESEIARLLRDLDDDDGIKRRRAHAKLVAAGQRVTPQLIPLLSSRQERLRWEAAKVLASIADPASVPELIAALEDREWSVRWVAAEALAHVGRPALLPLLNMLEERLENSDVRDNVHHVLHDLRDPQDRNLVAPVYHELSRCGDNLDLSVAIHQVVKALE